MKHPIFYNSLRPFYGWFQTGTPILTWHKLGPRPRRTRLKGLYLSARRFRRQLSELSQAGFASLHFDETTPDMRGRTGQVGLTFDDGYANVLRQGLAPLAEFRFQAIQFLVADRLGQTNDWDTLHGEAPEPLMDVCQVEEWMAAGHAIGAHTLTHPHLTQLSSAQAREEIASSKKKLEDRFGRAIFHFCYPYGDWNEAVRDSVIEAGYQSACTSDYGVNLADQCAYEFKRITARYPSRSFKAIWQWIQRRFG